MNRRSREDKEAKQKPLLIFSIDTLSAQSVIHDPTYRSDYRKIQYHSPVDEYVRFR
ncbi:uncharacterized protein PHALS_02136 [Plasmopara halstedii]|uniref:Uncharacterized protein n=1 Tax=Plasmopara halstedii TaxID=4781 RepID=A0A0P1AIX2_PLAHL|nr:uncharacterized protein PHALS_11274 [Plasmopara halstedii]XP_024582232.1 uncharacterized protein PHALS_02136 [Plasmopara halstedii]CEG41109.1 hypothetical protein PHALS_11274 [Plasmopara halstedii]CEG45863.1 hypothetical protein PHALS_02136 [Plasmopara halstedii]|eukprot:XP_024577478.1 hypothetical protein PHALS_11274 [Plasmopara halstedii]